jgi:hypothetical protein
MLLRPPCFPTPKTDRARDLRVARMSRPAARTKPAHQDPQRFELHLQAQDFEVLGCHRLIFACSPFPSPP